MRPSAFIRTLGNRLAALWQTWMRWHDAGAISLIAPSTHFRGTTCLIDVGGRQAEAILVHSEGRSAH